MRVGRQQRSNNSRQAIQRQYQWASKTQEIIVGKQYRGKKGNTAVIIVAGLKSLNCEIKNKNLKLLIYWFTAKYDGTTCSLMVINQQSSEIIKTHTRSEIPRTKCHKLPLSPRQKLMDWMKKIVNLQRAENWQKLWITPLSVAEKNIAEILQFTICCCYWFFVCLT